MIPSYERENPKLQFMCVTKRKMHDPDDTFYYAQVCKIKSNPSVINLKSSTPVTRTKIRYRNYQTQHYR